MDFDPENEKWRCCCFRIPTGLKILGIVETLCAVGVFAIVLRLINTQQNDKQGLDLLAIFHISLASIVLLIALTSALMVVGAIQFKHKLLYPTVAARVLLVIFVTVFGVSIGVARQAGNEADAENMYYEAPKKRVKIGGRKAINQQQPSTALRLVLLIFLMLVLSIAVFYTIFLVVRGIGYIQGYNRLKRRRSSFMAVAQIDPSLMAAKRPSQGSYVLQEQMRQQ